MKKAVSLVLSAVMIFTIALSAAAAARIGDVTGDGKINSSDALLVLMAKVGMKNLNSSQKSVADVDGNGQINSSDALLILSYSIGLIKKFPAEKTPDTPTEKPTEKPTDKPTEKTTGVLDHNDPDMGHGIY